MDVTEESGVVRLLVVRAQGVVGEVSVEWRTVDGTAVSSGKTPPDYLVSQILNHRCQREDFTGNRPQGAFFEGKLETSRFSFSDAVFR